MSWDNKVRKKSLWAICSSGKLAQAVRSWLGATKRRKCSLMLPALSGLLRVPGQNFREMMTCSPGAILYVSIGGESFNKHFHCTHLSCVLTDCVCTLWNILITCTGRLHCQHQQLSKVDSIWNSIQLIPWKNHWRLLAGREPVLGFELRASHFQGRHTTTWAMPLASGNFFKSEKFSFEAMIGRDSGNHLWKADKQWQLHSFKYLHFFGNITTT
jgi:hypothetical protein